MRFGSDARPRQSSRRSTTDSAPGRRRYLRAVASAIRGACLREDDRVFRYGGDEFTVICSTKTAAGAIILAERIRDALLVLDGHGGGRYDAGDVSASIGVATYPEFGPTAGEVLLAADRACFVAKRRGRGEIATALEGLALAGELTLQEPTPFDPREPATEDGSRLSEPAAPAYEQPTA